jgi:hypothetical protein
MKGYNYNYRRPAPPPPLTGENIYTQRHNELTTPAATSFDDAAHTSDTTAALGFAHSNQLVRRVVALTIVASASRY